MGECILQPGERRRRIGQPVEVDEEQILRGNKV